MAEVAEEFEVMTPLKKPLAALAAFCHVSSSFSDMSSPLILHISSPFVKVQLKEALLPRGADAGSGARRIACSAVQQKIISRLQLALQLTHLDIFPASIEENTTAGISSSRSLQGAAAIAGVCSHRACVAVFVAVMMEQE